MLDKIRKWLGFVRWDYTIPIVQYKAGAVRMHLGNKHTPWHSGDGVHEGHIWIHKSKLTILPYMQGNKQANLMIESKEK